MTMGDRVAVMRGGQLQQVDSPEQLYEHPANQFVAGFMGSPAMNMVEATLTRTGDELQVTLANYRLIVEPAAAHFFDPATGAAIEDAREQSLAGRTRLAIASARQHRL